MNRSSLLHIVERLEGFFGKLPETIRKPILHELTPLKELFLQQRSPRLLFIGSGERPFPEVLGNLFASAITGKAVDIPMEDSRWQDVNLDNHGTISFLDARGVDLTRSSKIQAELNRQPADIVLLFEDEKHRTNAQELPDLLPKKVIEIVFAKRNATRDGDADGSSGPDSLLIANEDNQFLGAFRFSEKDSLKESQRLMSILAREVPNEARIEMIRISRDREAQREVAQVLVKSTAAVCTAIGTQPIPLADLPILTTLQLLMVSGIMYVSGRERSLRAATEFIGALGANVGVGMLFREGTRALLKFFPGWGNVICGMVAGAGTYAIGRAAIVFFLEGMSLKDARRVYLRSRNRPERPQLPAPGRRRKTSKRPNKRLPSGE